MSQAIAVSHHEHDQSARGRSRSLLLAALLGLVFGALGFVVTEHSVGSLRTILSEVAAPEIVMEFPGRELPREWRGARKAVEYEHMFRVDPAPRLRSNGPKAGRRAPPRRNPCATFAASSSRHSR